LSIDALRERARNLSIEAKAASRQSLKVAIPSFYLLGNELDARGLQQEAIARTRAGFLRAAAPWPPD